MLNSIKLSNGRTIKIGSVVCIAYPPVAKIELVEIEGFQFAKLSLEDEDKPLFWLTSDGIDAAQAQKKYRYSSPTSEVSGYIHLLIDETGQKRTIDFFTVLKLREYNALNLTVSGEYKGKQVVWHP